MFGYLKDTLSQKGNSECNRLDNFKEQLLKQKSKNGFFFEHTF